MLHVLIWKDNLPGALYEVPDNNYESAINLAINLLNASNFEFNSENAKDWLGTDGYYIIPFRNFGVYILSSENL